MRWVRLLRLLPPLPPPRRTRTRRLDQQGGERAWKDQGQNQDQQGWQHTEGATVTRGEGEEGSRACRRSRR